MMHDFKAKRLASFYFLCSIHVSEPLRPVEIAPQTGKEECTCSYRFPYCWHADSYCYTNASSATWTEAICPGVCTENYVETKVPTQAPTPEPEQTAAEAAAEQKQILSNLDGKSIDLAACTAEGETLAVVAASKRHMDVLAFLHGRGVDLAASCDGGFSPATAAAYRGRVGVLAYLHDKASIDLAASDKKGQSPATAAAGTGHVKVLVYLRNKAGVDLAASDQAGRSPATAAAQYGRVEALAYIRDHAGVNLAASDQAGQSPATRAAKTGQVNVLVYLHDKAGVDLAVSDEKGFSPATFAATEGHVEVLTYLRDKAGIDLAASDKSRESPASDAAFTGQVKTLAYLRRAGVKLRDSAESGYSPATFAAKEGHVNVLTYLHDKARIDLRAADDSHVSPAIAAAQEGHVEVLGYLRNRADVDLADSEKTGWSPSTIAAFTGQVKVLDYLRVEAGVDEAASDSTRDSPASVAAKSGHVAALAYLRDKAGVDLAASDEGDNSPSTRAAKSGHVEVLTYLREKAGVDLSKSDESKDSPATNAAQEGHVKALAYLHEKAGVDLAACDDRGFAPSTEAAQDGHVEVLAYLRDKAGVDLARSDESGWSPATLAIKYVQMSALQYLHFNCSIDLNASNKNGWSSATIAAMYDGLDFLTFLGQNGVDLNVSDARGFSPAAVAATYGRQDVLWFLQNNSVDLTASCHNGSNPATEAAAAGNLDVLDYLQAEKLSLAASSAAGYSPSTIAVASNQVHVLEFLSQRGVDLQATDANGNSPETLAIRTNHTASLLFLQAKGLLKTDVWEFIKRRAANNHSAQRALLAEDLATAARSKLFIPRITPYLCELAQDEDRLVSWHAVDGLASCCEGEDDIGDDVLSILADKVAAPGKRKKHDNEYHIQIRASALRGLASMIGNNSNATEIVFKELKSKNLSDTSQEAIAAGYGRVCLGKNDSQPKSLLGRTLEHAFLQWNSLCLPGNLDCAEACLLSRTFSPQSQLLARLDELAKCQTLPRTARRVLRKIGNFLAADAQNKTSDALRQASHARQVANLLKQQSELAHEKLENYTAVAANMSNKTRKLIAYDSESETFKTPIGVMIQNFSGTLEAHRCPNPKACLEDTGINRCGRGYNASSAGCAKCETGYGRLPAEPFSCLSCPDPRWTFIAFVATPAIPFVLGMLGAKKSQLTSSYNSYLKILMAYSSAAKLVFNVLQQTQAVSTLQTQVALIQEEVFETSENAVVAFSGVGLFSHDCLLQKMKPYLWELYDNFILDALFLDMFMPFVLLLGSLVGAAWFGRRDIMASKHYFLWPFLVFTNNFTPAIFASLFRAYPCIHTQKGGREVLAYDPDVVCSASRLSWVAVAMTVCVFVVPLSWQVLLRNSYGQDPKLTGFLTKEYQDEFYNWQVVVLLRTIALQGIGTSVPVSYATHTHVILLTATLGAALVAHLYCKPYSRAEMNHLESFSLSSAILALLSTSLLVSKPWSQTEETLSVIFMCTATFVALVFCFLSGVVGVALLREWGVTVQMERLTSREF